MDLFNVFTFIEEIPSDIHIMDDMRYFELTDDTFNGKYRLVPCNFNAVLAILNANKYLQSNHINGHGLHVIISAQNVCSPYEYSGYRFPMVMHHDMHLDSKCHDISEKDVNRMPIYANRIFNRVQSNDLVTDTYVRKAKELIFASFNDFVHNNLHTLSNVPPFLADTNNKDMFAKVINIGSKYTGYDGLYMYESKVMFMFNMLVNSLNDFISSQKCPNVDAVVKLLSAMRIKRENTWMLADVLKFIFMNSNSEIESIFGIISGVSSESFNDITCVPERLWSYNLSHVQIDNITKQAKGYDNNGNIVYIKYTTYDKMDDDLVTDDTLLLIDVMPISMDCAIFKLTPHTNKDPCIIRFIEIGNSGVPRYAVKTTIYSELVTMANSRLRDALLFVIRLSIFSYDVFIKKEKHAFSTTAMQRYFRVLFHRKFIMSNVTNMYDVVFDMMMSYLYKDPEHTLEDDERDDLAQLNVRLNILSSFVDSKLEAIGSNRSDEHIDKFLSQLVDIYKYDLLLMLH